MICRMRARRRNARASWLNSVTDEERGMVRYASVFMTIPEPLITVTTLRCWGDDIAVEVFEKMVRILAVLGFATGEMRDSVVRVPLVQKDCVRFRLRSRAVTGKCGVVARSFLRVVPCVSSVARSWVSVHHTCGTSFSAAEKASKHKTRIQHWKGNVDPNQVVTSETSNANRHERGHTASDNSAKRIETVILVHTFNVYHHHVQPAPYMIQEHVHNCVH